MWIYTTSGFFSAVDHLDKRGWVLLRARFRGDLERLFCRHQIALDDFDRIRETRNADYRFRVGIRKDAFARVVMEECMSIDYPNFKAACPADRHGLYLRVWSIMRNQQDAKADR